MKDVTDLVQDYRFALRNIWNHSIWRDASRRNWDSVNDLPALRLPLYNALVRAPLQLDPAEAVFGDAFHVVPRPNPGFIQRLEVRNQPDPHPGGAVWYPVTGMFAGQGLQLVLVDLFDWNLFDYLDLRYYLVEIQMFAAHPEFVGCRALVDVNEANVVYI